MQENENRNMRQPNRRQLTRQEMQARIAQRKKKRRKKMIVFYTVCALILMAMSGLVFGVVYLVKNGLNKTPQLSTAPSSLSVSISSVSQSGVDSITQPEPEPEPVKERTWELLLANIDNPLPESYDANVTMVTPFSNSAQQCDARIQEALTKMFHDAAAAGHNLYFRSGYRSYATQQYLFSSMQNNYIAQGYSEAEAYAQTRKWRNPAGTSEHQTGLAADIVPLSNPQVSLTADLENATEIQWLHQHCAEYGFILRYPSDKTDITGTSYEPWHFRYVGVDAATEIMQKGWTLEEYIETYFPSEVS